MYDLVINYRPLISGYLMRKYLKFYMKYLDHLNFQIVDVKHNSLLFIY